LHESNFLKGALAAGLWTAGTERFGGIPGVMSPAATAAFVAEQFQLHDRLGRQLGIEPK
jgi:hypothetical protein